MTKPLMLPGFAVEMIDGERCLNLDAAATNDDALGAILRETKVLIQLYFEEIHQEEKNEEN